MSNDFWNGDGPIEDKDQDELRKKTLGDVVLLITVQEVGDTGYPYPANYVYRFDLEHSGENVESLVEHIREHPAIIDASKCVAKEIGD